MPSHLPPSMAALPALEADSYFPLSTLDMPVGEKGGFASLGIDESQFRYSLDMRETGTPTVGIYARDGLWDEEDEEAESSLGDTTVSSSSGGRRTRPPSGTGSTWTSSDKRSMTSKTAGSTKGRSRSGTVTASSAHGHSSAAVSPGLGSSPVLPTYEDKSRGGGGGGGWSWGRKASGGASAIRSPIADTKGDQHEKPAKALKEKRSFSKLIGKGRRGDLRVDVNDENKRSDIPPVPSTPSSFLTSPSVASPMASPMPNEVMSPGSSTPLKSPGWKRSVSRIFRSKSSMALRDAMANGDEHHDADAPPPVPQLPSHLDLPKPPTRNPLGQPFSASTPVTAVSAIHAPAPMGLSSPAPSAMSDSFAMRSPLLPVDPFEHMDIPVIPASSASPDQKDHKGPRNSPSLRDLRNFLLSPGKSSPGANSSGGMTRAKSAANLKASALGPEPFPAFLPSLAEHAKTLPVSSPTSRGAPLKRMISRPELVGTTEFGLLASPPPRTESVPPVPPHAPFASPRAAPTPLGRGLASPHEIVSRPPLELAIGDNASSQPQRSAAPGSASLPVLSVVTNLPIREPIAAGPLSPAPTAPLPPIPSVMPVSIPLGAPLSSLTSSKQSPASGINQTVAESDKEAVAAPTDTPSPAAPDGPASKLSPLRRQASMVIANNPPPKSSSFYELYLQLGVWPTGNQQDTESVSSPLAQGKTSPLNIKKALPNSESQMTDLAPKSWDDALNAFPMAPSEEDAPSEEEAAALVASPVDLSNVLPESPQKEVSDPVADPVTTLSSAPSASSLSYTKAAPGSSSARGSQSFSAGQASSSSAGASGSSHQASTNVGMSSSSVEMLRSREGSHSGSSSRRSSRSRRPARRPASVDVMDQWGSSSESEDDEDDDVPLSQLHPDAAAAQQAKQRAAKAARAARAARHAATKRVPQPLGRNPGGGTGWDGEGGIPAGILTQKLEELVAGLSRQSSIASVARSTRSMAESSSSHQAVRPPPPTRSLTDTTAPHPKRSSSRPGIASTDVRVSPNPLVFAQSSPTAATSATVGGLTVQQSSLPKRSSSVPMQASLPRRSSSVPQAVQASVSMSAGSSSQGLASGGSKRGTPVIREEEGEVPSALPIPPLPKREKPITVQIAISQTTGRKLSFDVYTDTTAKEVIAQAEENGDLTGAKLNQAWVVIENFAELGCERQVREYEKIKNVTAGWDPSNSANCLFFRLSNRANQTMQRRPPFLGGWIQYEAKRGKWQKRWLETRGGEMFIAKNEKNKDEVHVSTAFFDIYQMTVPYPGPKPFVFLLKRVEPKATFENPEDYTHVFCIEEGQAWKLMSALYDAKSFSLMPPPRVAPAPVRPGQKGLLSPGLPPAPGSPRLPQGQGRGPSPSPFAAAQAAASQGGASREPLINLQKDRAERSGFTGKGLLK